MTADRPLRVLHVIDRLGIGGAETWLMELLRHWSKTGAARMELLATSGERGIFDGEAIQLGARIHYVSYRRTNLPRFLKQFRRLLADGRYDVIHDHADYVSGWHFLMGAGRLPPSRVTHVHNPWLHIEANYGVSVPRRFTAIAGKRLVHLLATDVCGTSAEILRQYGFDPGAASGPAVSVAHCGIDVAKFNAPRQEDRESVLREFGWSQDSNIALFAGRLDRALVFDHPQNHKNSWFAVNVARAAAAKDPTMRLLMAGAGDEPRRQIESHIRSWGLQGALRVLGVRDDVPRLMRASDALLFPSRQEGLGMVAVEAQAASLPVLASTAVPRECVVIPELYEALSLSAGMDVWVDALLKTTRKQRPSLESCRAALESSPFSIANSAGRLERIYRTTAT